MILLDICTECTWQIIPMLLGAWLLGWLFWWLANRPKYQEIISGLEGDIDGLKTKVSGLEENVREAKYETEKVNVELAALNTSHSDLALQHNIAKEKNLDLDTKLAAALAANKVASTGKVDTSKLDARIASLENELGTKAKAHDQLQTDYDALKAKYESLEAQSVAAPPPTKAKEETPTVNVQESAKVDVTPLGIANTLESASTTPTKEESSNVVSIFKKDNLQIVEGIGPKIESLLKDGGINDWATLASADQHKLQTILDNAGSRYRIHDPKTWPEQAKLANDGKWKELKEYQRFLGGGKEKSDTVASGFSKVEKLEAKLLGIRSTNPQDLKVIEGIGPKIEKLLKEAGINSWKELATTDPAKIKEILSEAGDSFRLADPKTWPKQANLANKGSWKALQEYQDILDGGKE